MRPGAVNGRTNPAEMIVLVPAHIEGDRVYVRIHRHSKRSTMVGCIRGDGGVMNTMIITDYATMEHVSGTALEKCPWSPSHEHL